MLERFMDKVCPEPNSGCWLWTAGIFPKGYGNFHYKGKGNQASRISYELFTGQIPDGLLVCHRCDTPACVNPQHLFLGTAQDNAVDMVRKGRANRATGRKHGRPKRKLTEANVFSIRALAKTETQTSLAKKFGVSVATICRAINGQSWIWLG